MTTSTQPSRPRWEPHFLRLSKLADRFLPEGVTDPESVRSKRTVVLGAIVGFFFANATAASYWGYGSSWSAGAITLISVGLLTVPVLVRRGASTATIGHVMTALTAQAALVVASRSGGLDSPAVAWFFMLPVISYLACGYSGSLGWAAAALLAIVGLFAADRAGIDFAQDFTADTLSILRVSGYPGVIISTAILMMMVESVRLASLEERDRAASALERERLLRDMHDGVGGHLMGLIVRVRSHQLSEPALLHGLEACLNDVRLVVDCLDPTERSLELALGELRQRSMLQCEAAGVRLDWVSDGADQVVLQADQTLEVLRALQEMLSNAIRHANPKRIALSVRLHSTPRAVVVSVEDDGSGFDPKPPRTGRGLSSLKARATRLSGQVVIAPATPGTRVTLSFPLRPTAS